MTTKMNGAATGALFDLSALRAVDSIDVEIKHPATLDPTGWIWTLAGPGHPQTLDFAERAQRKRLHEDRMKEQSRVNGKKWRGDEKDPDEIRQENIAGIAARVTNFTPVALDGAEITYSQEAATRLLLDPTFGWLLGQIVDALTADDGFFQKSGGAS